MHDAVQCWVHATQHYRTIKAPKESVRGMQRLVDDIVASPYISGIWSWTSVFDLCIAQLPVHEPMSAPYLRISPLSDGTIKFVYLDTTIASRMWTRTVPQDQAFARLESFFAQLRWFGGPG